MPNKVNANLGAQTKVARRRKFALTGKHPARPALVRPGDFLIAKESLRRSLPRHFLASASHHTGVPPVCVFQGMAESFWSDGVSKAKPLKPGRGTASRWSAPEAQSKDATGGTTRPAHRPQMSSDRLFLDRVARQHCPSPLHRHTQINMHSPEAQAKGDISILPGGGHFYFALTCRPLG